MDLLRAGKKRGGRQRFAILASVYYLPLWDRINKFSRFPRTKWVQMFPISTVTSKVKPGKTSQHLLSMRTQHISGLFRFQGGKPVMTFALSGAWVEPKGINKSNIFVCCPCGVTFKRYVRYE